METKYQFTNLLELRVLQTSPKQLPLRLCGAIQVTETMRKLTVNEIIMTFFYFVLGFQCLSDQISSHNAYALQVDGS